jgi:hypothetical protein
MLEVWSDVTKAQLVQPALVVPSVEVGMRLVWQDTTQAQAQFQLADVM